MEVRGQQPGGADEARARFRKVQAELAQANRDRVQEARENLESLPLRRRQAAQERARTDQAQQAEQDGKAENRPLDEILMGQTRETEGSADGRDKIELSGEVLGTGALDDSQRAERVAELREAYLNGTLNTPARVERAVVQLLGGDDTPTPKTPPVEIS